MTKSIILIVVTTTLLITAIGFSSVTKTANIVNARTEQLMAIR